MLIDKIKLSYKIYFFKYKIKYSETRKPSFIEFVIINTIISRGNETRSLQEILKEIFNISKFDLFERVFRELENIKIISKVPSSINFRQSNMHIPINQLIISENISVAFKNKTFIISQNNKYKEVFFMYDPLNKSSSVRSDTKWDKNSSVSNFSYEINTSPITQDHIDIDDIKNKSMNYLKDRSDIFGDNASFLDVEDEFENSIEDKNEIFKHIDESHLAYEIEIDVNEKIKIRAPEKLNPIFIREDIRINFLKKIVDQYNKKTQSIFKINKKTNYKNRTGELESIFTLPIKINWNILFINMNKITSITEFEKLKKFFKNVNLVVQYNSKSQYEFLTGSNRSVISFKREIESQIFNEASIVYSNNTNDITAFAIEEFELKNINAVIPVTNELDFEENKEFNKVLQPLRDEGLEYLDLIISDGDGQKGAWIIAELLKLGMDKEIKDYLEENVLDSVKKIDIYNSLREGFLKYKLKDKILMLEQIIVKKIISYSQTNPGENILNIIKDFNIENKKNLISLFTEIPIGNEFENTKIICRFLESKNLDPWEINLGNCLTNMSTHFSTRLTSGVFNDYASKSKTFNQHVKLYDLIGKMITSVSKDGSITNYISESVNYNFLVLSVINIIQENLNNVDDLNSYLLGIASSLQEFYKIWYELSENYLKSLDVNTIEYKTKLNAIKYINKIDSKISLVTKSTMSNKMPIEVKIEYLKYVENKSDEVNKIINNSNNLIVEALTLFFGNTIEVDEKILKQKNNWLGSVK